MKSNIIRTATEHDLEAINQLFWELDSDAIRFQPDHFQRCVRENGYLQDILHSQNSDFLLAVADNKTVGFSLIFEKETKGLSLLVPCRYAYIQDFIVNEAYRNQGIGTQLMEASKQWAKDRDLEYLRLSVFPVNESGIRFYKRHGLEEQMLTMECRIDESLQ